MQAIIRQGNGKYYTSAVFGYYNNVTSEDDYQRYLESIHSPYYIVFNEDKTQLIKLPVFQKGTRYLIPQLIIVESDQSNWTLDDEGIGEEAFLSRELIENIISTGIDPDVILDRCRQLDKSYIYNEYPEIRTQHDIDNLDWASGNFHDAYIAEQKLLDDETIYLLFDGVWGCKIEVWLWGELEYSTNSRNPDEYDPYWYSSTVLIQDDLIYFIDDENMKPEDITDGYCWFKARHMKYHIIPE